MPTIDATLPQDSALQWSRRSSAAAFAIATVLGVVTAAQSLALQTLEQQRRPMWAVLLFSLFSWWCWASVAPLVFRLAHRWPIRPRWLRAMAVHLGAVVGFTALFAFLLAVLLQLLPLDTDVPRPVAGVTVGLAVSRLQGNLLIYATLAAIAWSLQLRHAAQVQAVRAASLEGALAQAELEALRMQLDPHFLFNTLHAIRTLIEDDPAGAERMLVRLGELLHATLGAGRTQEIPLRDELALLRGYLEIEATRFADRLTVRIDVPDALLDVRIPSFALQPLAENAIRHGIARRIDGGYVHLSASEVDRMLVIEMRNSAAADPVDGSTGHGIGLATTRARLHRLYGASADLTLVRDADEMLLTFRVPLAR